MRATSRSPSTISGPDGSVLVATAANQPEAELLQGLLELAGIPSIWRRIGGDVPHLMAGGYRAIYVPPAAADEARAVLATTTEPDDQESAGATRRVVAERTPLRLFGKATIVVYVFGALLFVLATLLTGALWTLAVVIVLAVTAGVVIWSERSRGPRD